MVNWFTSNFGGAVVLAGFLYACANFNVCGGWGFAEGGTIVALGCAMIVRAG
jgi:hypothetical protein